MAGIVEVVAALIVDGGRFLACRRPARKARGGLWEFVGGKVEAGETKAEALLRECLEELGVELVVGDVFMELVHEYPDITVRLTLFEARISKGAPKLIEHGEMRWLSADEIDGYEFCPADKDILARLKKTLPGGAVPLSIRAGLFDMQDAAYRDFHAKLMPTVDKSVIIGVRAPDIRKFAKRIDGSAQAREFMAKLPHAYYDENNLHGALISRMRDCGAAIEALEAFLPHVDNWATCDMISVKAFGKRPDELTESVRRWLASGKTYTVRFGIVTLMTHYLGEGFSPEHLELVAGIKSGEYYVRMAAAWYFATALAKQYEAAIEYIEAFRLDPWTHNKAIQKAAESRRVPDERKEYLKTLKVK